MPRKKNTCSSDFNEAFPSRLRKIMEEKGKTQQELADAIGKTRQAVGYYADGSSSPDWKTIAAIANHLEVSADWLLGLSSTPAIDDRARSACDFLGLSLDAARFLYKNKTNHPFVETVNFLLEAHEIISDMANYFAAFTLQSITSEPYKYIPLKGQPTNNLSAVAFAKLIECLPGQRDLFIEKYSKDDAFVDQCIRTFIEKNIDLKECNRIITYYETDWDQVNAEIEDFYRSADYTEARDWLFEQIEEEHSAEMAECEEANEYRAVCSFLHSLAHKKEDLSIK